MNDITKVEVVDIDKLELAQRSAIVRPVDLAGTILAYEEFETVKKELLNDNDFAYFDSGGKMVDKGKGNGYIKKSGWRKIKTAFGISISLDDGRRTTGVDAEGNYYVWRYKTRATTPNGIYQDADGACSSRKAFFSKKYGKRVDPDEEDIILMAQTVAINRVISDLVGGGEVSAEEMYGRDEVKAVVHVQPTPVKALPQQPQAFDRTKLDPNAKPPIKFNATTKKPYCPTVQRLYAIATKTIGMSTEEFKTLCMNITGKEHSKDYTNQDCWLIEDAMADADKKEDVADVEYQDIETATPKELEEHLRESIKEYDGSIE